MKKLLFVTLLGLLINSCNMDDFDTDFEGITTKSNILALPIGSIKLSPDFLVNNLFSGGNADSSIIKYRKVGADSLAHISLNTNFDITEGFSNNPSLTGGSEGTERDIPVGLNVATMMNSSSGESDINLFSGLGETAKIKFNEGITIFLKLANGFNQNLTIRPNFRFLDSLGNTVTGVTFDNTPKIITKNSTNEIIINITGFNKDVAKTKLGFTFSFVSNPTKYIVQSNGTPINVEGLSIDIPLDIEVSDFKISSSSGEEWIDNPLYKYFSENLKKVELRLFLEEGSEELPISNLGFVVNFADEDTTEIQSLRKAVNIFPTASDGFNNKIDFTKADIEGDMKKAKFMKFKPGSIEKNRPVKIRFIKGESRVKMDFKVEGSVTIEN